jgi:hypothetical protein
MLQIGRWGDGGRCLRGGPHTASTLDRARRSGPGAIRADYDALPIATNSVEAVLLPHTLEHAPRRTSCCAKSIACSWAKATS